MRVLPPLGQKNKLVDYVRDHEVPTDGNPDLMTMTALKSAAYSYDELLFTRASAGSSSRGAAGSGGPRPPPFDHRARPAARGPSALSRWLFGATMLGMVMPLKIVKEVHFTNQVDLTPTAEKMKKGTKTLVKDQLHSLKRDLEAVSIKPEVYLTEFGPSFDSWEAKCARLWSARRTTPRATVGTTKSCRANHGSPRSSRRRRQCARKRRGNGSLQ